MKFVDQKGQVPYLEDTTRNWVESNRTDGKIKPSLLLRYATDTNYIRNGKMPLYGSGDKRTKSVMNLAYPCQRVFGPVTWQVQETSDGIVQSASVDIVNALPLSTTSTTLVANPNGSGSVALSGLTHSSMVRYNYMNTSMGTIERENGNADMVLPITGANIDPKTQTDPWGYKYEESDVKYREYDYQYIYLADATDFPNPAIRTGDIDNDTDDGYYPTATDGVGAYYVLLGGNEVVRVVNKDVHAASGLTRLWIPAGGRNINGKLRSHSAGATCILLGIGPFRGGEYAGMGYLNVDDYAPQRALLRTGTCLVSYEGYGDITQPLEHKPDRKRNYQFTGYWFVQSVEPSIGTDGIPKIRVDLRNAGHLYDSQKITADILRRMKTQFGQWRVGEANKTIWGAAGHSRNIPGDWADYDNWDPSLKDSYPLKISIELAQHKEFYDHMREKNMGAACDICIAEQREWIKQHGVEPSDPVMKERGTGRHVYKQSIRVLQESAGPVKTYIRLMSTICAAAWDHPAYGTELAQKFTKIPNTLFENMQNIYTGLVYNGRVDFNLENEKSTDLSTPTYESNDIVMRRAQLLSPFESTYDRAPFSQPMLDLAEINNMQFWVNREGYPVFKPRLDDLRPSGRGYSTIAGWKAASAPTKLPAESSEWHMRYGASLDSYSTSINPESIITQMWVTANTAFNSTFTIACAGTGWTTRSNEDSQPIRVNYSPLAGNKEGLALTSGVQQTETMGLDNLQLGFSWDTKPAQWGAIEERDGEGNKVMNAKPPMPNSGQPNLDVNSSDKAHKAAILRLQAVINFFLIRHYIEPVEVPGNVRKWWQIEEDGKFGPVTKYGLMAVQTQVGATSSGVWNKSTRNAILTYLDTHKHYIKFDVWWYVMNNREWEEYVAAITGVPIPTKAAKQTSSKPKSGSKQSVTTPRWIPDQKGMMKNIEDWHKNFHGMTVNAGNNAVDQSIDRATARSISSPLADPRIQPGDVIWCEVPGFLGLKNGKGENKPPFNNGIYVTNLSRQMDLQQGTYTMTASGHRFRGNFGLGVPNVGEGYAFIENDRKLKT